MDLLDRLLGHDVWTTRQLLVRAGELSDAQLDQRLDLSQGSVRAELAHIIRNMEAWSDQLSAVPIREPGGRSIGELSARLDRAASDLARAARSVADRDAWDERWSDPDEQPAVCRTYGGTIAHVLTHSMHHRAHVLVMLRRLGLTGLPEGDALSWEAQLPPR